MNLERTEQKDIKKIVFSYLKYWYIFIIGGAIGLIAAHLVLSYSTPEYSISTTILIKDEKSGAGLTPNAAFSDIDVFKTTKTIDNEIIILQSKSLMDQAISELDLSTSYFIKGRVQDQEIYGKDLPISIIISKLDPSAYNKSILIYIKDNNNFEIEEKDDEAHKRTSHKFGQQIEKSYGKFTVIAKSGLILNKARPIVAKFQDTKELSKIYAGKLNIIPYNNKASALVLSITDAVPEKGIDIINKLIEVYHQEEVNDKNQIAEQTLSFIDERLKYLTSELSTVEKNVEDYKRQNDLTNVSLQAEQYASEASVYNKELGDLSIQLDVLESIEKYLSNQKGKYALVPSSLTIPDPTLVGLITKFNQLQLEREQLLRNNSSENPLVQNINNQLTNLRINILENLRNIKASLEISRKNLQLKSGQFGSKIRQVPVVERQLIEITRQQEIKQSIYLYLLQKREESALSLASTVSNSRVIDPATYWGPVSPNVNNTYIYYLLLGLFLPFAGIFIKGLLNNKVQSIDQVQILTPTPILGQVAHNKSGQLVAVKDNGRSPITEMFRLILTNLQFSNIKKNNNVLLVTSSMSGEGKTFISVNLGISLAATGKKVVILDFDLRKPGFQAELGLLKGKGVSNYLVSEEMIVDDIIQASGIDENLYVIGPGTMPPNPYELMLSPRVENLINILKANFDYIIIDTAPVGQVADAFTLSPYIDTSIYVVRFNYTLKDQLTVIDDIYANNKLNQPMLVLNDAKQMNGYGYGYGYGQEKKQSSLIKLFKKN